MVWGAGFVVVLDFLVLSGPCKCLLWGLGLQGLGLQMKGLYTTAEALLMQRKGARRQGLWLEGLGVRVHSLSFYPFWVAAVRFLKLIVIRATFPKGME